MTERVNWVATIEALQAVVQEISGEDRVAVDLESNGLFAYHAQVCTAQLAWHGSSTSPQIAVVDTLALGLDPLRAVLEDATLTKVVHDVCFDAHLLGQEGVRLVAVRDTAVQAAYLGFQSTGLQALLAAELGIHLNKALQLSDWRRRPVDPQGLEYLACDVRYLLDLEKLLWSQVNEQGIESEVTTETEYRLKNARESASKEIRPLLRIRGLEQVDEISLAVIGELADERERLARDADVPAQRLVSDRTLVALGRSRPSCLDEIVEAPSLQRLDARVARRFLQAIGRGVAPGALAEQDLALLRRQPLERREIDRRKRIEKRLRAWREAERARRHVSLQVILPGHCIRRLASGSWETAEQIAQMNGLGTARASRYADQLSRIVLGEDGG